MKVIVECDGGSRGNPGPAGFGCVVWSADHGTLLAEHKLALVAPRIATAGCSARDASFYGTLEVRNLRPALKGPLRGAALRCADGRMRAVSPQIALDLSLSALRTLVATGAQAQDDRLP